ncbi:MAG: HD domain-containing protein [Sulfurospirillum sp.]|nr:HD domain-containing protein [Sulfurospirillum sp.]
MQLRYHIEELFAKNASEFEISQLIKNHIRKYLGSLDKLFEENQGKDFLVKHTKRIDNFLILIYKYTLRKFFGNYIPFQNQLPIALIAMGSYGREELCIYSDIDLMIVYKEIRGYNTEAIIESMLRLIWDAGIKLGHRVHKIEDIFTASNSDLTIKTAMLESRFLFGSQFIWIESSRELHKIRNYHLKEFIKEKLAAHKDRRTRYPLSMEPDIKNSVGGLRDTNTLFWVAKAILNITKLKDLVPKYISEEEFREFRIALEFLFRVRSALHITVRKKQDKLNLEYIPDIAKKLGFIDKKLKNAQVQLSEKTLASMHTIDITTQIFLKKLTAPYLFSLKNLQKLKEHRIEKGVYLIDECVVASRHQNPSNITDILAKLTKFDSANLQYDISFVDFVRRSHYPSVNSKQIYKQLRALFFNKYVYATFCMLYDASVLSKLIKPFERITNLAQFDGYHAYPVDKHSLLNLYHLENIKDFFIKALYDDLCGEGKALIKLVALMHDIGKGRRADHRDIGAIIFKTYAIKLHFSDEGIKFGQILIKHHTLMSSIATKEDIYSEAVILSFISKLEDVRVLKLLYILTYCDLNSVAKGIYTNFNARLLHELYNLSVEMFDKKELMGETKRRLRRENILKKSEAFQALPKSLQRKTFLINSNLFFIKHKSHEIMKIIKIAASDTIYTCKIENESYLTLSIIKSKDLNLGYLLGKLSFLDLINMEIFKLFDDKKYFKIEFNERVGDDDIEYIKQLIDESFDMNKTTKLTKPIILSGEIKLDCDHSKTYAKMTINAKNQKGMMAYMMSIFDTEGIDVANAKIVTIKNRARNLILIEKKIELCKNKQKILEFFI